MTVTASVSQIVSDCSGWWVFGDVAMGRGHEPSWQAKPGKSVLASSCASGPRKKQLSLEVSVEASDRDTPD